MPDSGRLPSLVPPSPPTPIMRAATWGIVILFLAVPLLAVTDHRGGVLWAVWAFISLWAALDSYTIGAALSTRPTRSKGPLMLALALLNLLTALSAIVKPFVTR